jgi:hypothetical protein
VTLRGDRGAIRHANGVALVWHIRRRGRTKGNLGAANLQPVIRRRLAARCGGAHERQAAIQFLRYCYGTERARMQPASTDRQRRRDEKRLPHDPGNHVRISGKRSSGRFCWESGQSLSTEGVRSLQNGTLADILGGEVIRCRAHRISDAGSPHASMKGPSLSRHTSTERARPAISHPAARGELTGAGSYDPPPHARAPDVLVQTSIRARP